MYIGQKKIKTEKELNEKTISGNALIELEYKDGTKEVYSKELLDMVKTDKACDESELRDKRIFPVVSTVLTVLRDYGVKLNELSYFSAVLTRSLEENRNEALKKLWKDYSPNIQSHDEVDLVAVDRVLRA